MPNLVQGHAMSSRHPFSLVHAQSAQIAIYVASAVDRWVSTKQADGVDQSSPCPTSSLDPPRSPRPTSRCHPSTRTTRIEPALDFEPHLELGLNTRTACAEPPAITTTPPSSVWSTHKHNLHRGVDCRLSSVCRRHVGFNRTGGRSRQQTTPSKDYQPLIHSTTTPQHHCVPRGLLRVGRW